MLISRGQCSFSPLPINKGRACGRVSRWAGPHAAWRDDVDGWFTAGGEVLDRDTAGPRQCFSVFHPGLPSGSERNSHGKKKKRNETVLWCDRSVLLYFWGNLDEGCVCVHRSVHVQCYGREVVALKPSCTGGKRTWPSRKEEQHRKPLQPPTRNRPRLTTLSQIQSLIRSQIISRRHSLGIHPLGVFVPHSVHATNGPAPNCRWRKSHAHMCPTTPIAEPKLTAAGNSAIIARTDYYSQEIGIHSSIFHVALPAPRSKICPSHPSQKLISRVRVVVQYTAGHNTAHTCTSIRYNAIVCPRSAPYSALATCVMRCTCTSPVFCARASALRRSSTSYCFGRFSSDHTSKHSRSKNTNIRCAGAPTATRQRQWYDVSM